MTEYKTHYHDEHGGVLCGHPYGVAERDLDSVTCKNCLKKIEKGYRDDDDVYPDRDWYEDDSYFIEENWKGVVAVFFFLLAVLFMWL